MSEHTRRVGTNEAVFRAVNEEIESLNRGIAKISDFTMHIVCECQELSCAEQLTVPVSDYERVRTESTLFLVQPGHERPELEDVVERSERFHVVRKRDQEARQVAKETDPRST